MTADERNTDISFYEAGYQRKYCTVPAGTSPLSCALEDLKAGTKYRVYGTACMPDYECSHRKFAEGYTLPDGWLPTTGLRLGRLNITPFPPFSATKSRN